jgi:hypothetical protein
MIRILFLFLFISSAAFGQLSDSVTISVITCGPGQSELYSAFGHSAFRVHDPQTGYDAAYNYGVFNFRQKHFYLNFARGYLYYQLGVHDYRDFEYHYISDNRFVHEQVLDLTIQQKQRLIDFLNWNARPENQYYRYDYFYDNCATKIRDVIQHVFGDSVSFDSDHITTDYTIRELTDLYLPYQPWGDLGIDICLGLPMDKKAAPLEYMFLPDYVEKGFSHASIKQGTEERPLVKATNIVYSGTPDKLSHSIFHPLIVFFVVFLFVCFISYKDLRRKKLSNSFDAVLFSVTGAIGLLLLFLWFATDHKAAAKNFNLLWALPTHIIAVFAFIKQPKWLAKYFFVVMIISLFTLGTWPILPQKLHYALIPIVLAVTVRSYVQYKIRAVYKKQHLPVVD